MKRVMSLMVLFTFTLLGHAAQLKGKPMNGSRFKGELTLQGGSPVKGKVKFRSGKKLTFTAHNGTELELRIRPICADTREENMDACWPKLKIDVDDGSSRTGELILEK
jgi:hypothetical protein